MQNRIIKLNKIKPENKSFLEKRLVKIIQFDLRKICFTIIFRWKKLAKNATILQQPQFHNS